MGCQLAEVKSSALLIVAYYICVHARGLGSIRAIIQEERWGFFPPIVERMGRRALTSCCLGDPAKVGALARRSAPLTTLIRTWGGK